MEQERAELVATLVERPQVAQLATVYVMAFVLEINKTVCF